MSSDVVGPENWLSSPQAKDMRSVVLCVPKEHVSTGNALLGRLKNVSSFNGAFKFGLNYIKRKVVSGVVRKVSNA